ncbi:MAG: putative DNA polymerase [Phage 65_10]|nr:MAG: putative DNA polymerase [Phage 65_10]
MTHRFDFETYSEAGFVWVPATRKWTCLPNASQNRKGLFIVGAAVYAMHPTTEVLCLRYDVGAGLKHWRPGLPPPFDLFAAVQAGALEAWNSAFERWVWDFVCRRKYGWPEWPYRNQRCAMARARAYALPGKLELAAQVTDAAHQKDKEGTRLLDKFSSPRNPTKADGRTRILPVWSLDAPPAYPPGTVLPKGWLGTDYADTMAFDRYNAFDVLAEADVSEKTPELTGEELAYWQVDQAVNRRGVHIDATGVENAIAIIEQCHARYGDECRGITGGISPSELQQLQGWLRGRGVHLDSMDEEAITAALTWDLDPISRRVLELRGLVGSAAVKKVYAMRNTIAPTGRIHDLFGYHAARTGRANGNGAQPTNFPNSGPEMRRCGLWIGGRIVPNSGCGRHFRVGRLQCPWCGQNDAPARPSVEWSPEAADDAREVVATRSLSLVEDLMGPAMPVVSGTLRGLFCAAVKHDLLSSDYSSIEAVVTAMLAHVPWRIEVFRTHGKIYEASAAQMFDVPLDEMLAHKKQTGSHHPLRKLGKVAELALGFLGWVNAAKQFDMPGTDEEIKQNILKWRAASPEIVHLGGGQSHGRFRDAVPWLFGCEGTAIAALRDPGTTYDVMRLDGQPSGVSYLAQGATLFAILPSGRRLTYHNCVMAPSTREWSNPWEVSLSFEGYNTNPKNGPTGWIRMNTYAGKLLENCIAEGTPVLTRRGWVPIEKIVFNDKVWDGLEFVSHAGKIDKGVQTCQRVDGVWMTPDHEVLTNDGWATASSLPEPLRADFWTTDSDAAGRCEKRPRPHVAAPMFLQRVVRESGLRPVEGPEGGETVKLWVRDQGAHRPGQHDARHEQAPGLRGVEVDDRPVPLADAPGVGELRGPWHHGLRRVAAGLYALLGGHGANLRARLGNRPTGQQRGLRSGELPLGAERRAGKQQARERSDQHLRRPDERGASRPRVRDRQDDDHISDRSGVARGQVAGAPELRGQRVFDLLNCGPRHRFVVQGDAGPFIVHNCIQATARDVLRRASINLEAAGYGIVMHIYDELVCEVPSCTFTTNWSARSPRTLVRSKSWSASWPTCPSGPPGGRSRRLGAGVEKTIARAEVLHYSESIPTPERQVLNYSPSFGGFAFSSARRAHASPCSSSFAFRASLTRRVCFSVRPVPGGAGGRPRGRFGCSSMRAFYARQKVLAMSYLMSDNKCTDKPENDMPKQTTELTYEQARLRIKSIQRSPCKGRSDRIQKIVDRLVEQGAPRTEAQKFCDDAYDAATRSAWK